MFFIGIDLAWSNKNNSAVSIVEGNKDQGELKFFNYKIKSNENVVSWVSKKIKNNSALIAIDAPLIVPNKKGIRKSDKLITKLFWKYDAHTYPANREVLGKYDGLRGEKIVRLFEELGYKHVPHLKPKRKIKGIIEVYPHPAIVVLFNLDKIIKYKAKINRSYEFRWKEFKRLKNYILNLKNKEPSLKIPKKLINRKIEGLKGKALKEYEDFLDSIICAYIAHYYWYWGSKKCFVFGNLEEGYIVSPIFGWMKKILKETN